MLQFKRFEFTEDVHELFILVAIFINDNLLMIALKFLDAVLIEHYKYTLFVYKQKSYVKNFFVKNMI